jgi:hypothetical protein
VPHPFDYAQGQALAFFLQEPALSLSKGRDTMQHVVPDFDFFASAFEPYAARSLKDISAHP